MFKAMNKNSAEMYRSKLKIKTSENTDNQIQKTNLNSSSSSAPPPLKNFSLRGNQLCGSILIGNYNYLTQLEVSENEMEVLDLSSLAQLETLKCSRNKLTELMINGSNLTSVIADHNGLRTITATIKPMKLSKIDLSHNELTQLPNWLGSCTELQSLNAQCNQLTNLTDFISSYQIKTLKILNISCNNLRLLNRLPEKMSSIEELYLHSNELQSLPENFFDITQKQLRILNLSCNKLVTLTNRISWTGDLNLALEILMLSNNNLNDSIFEILAGAVCLRILHLAYNKLAELPVMCLQKWINLEVLVLSGNLLQQLPECITSLKRLQVLRVHSNLLLSTPILSKLSSLKVLDLAHNHLDRINLLNIMPKQLKYLDLSCNMQLQVDERQVKVCQNERKWSLIDVSGKNRNCLPTAKFEELKEKNNGKQPWSLGFSETPGDCRKLFVSQLRFSNFRSEEEGLFGIFESNASSVVVKTLAMLVPKLIQQERMVKETSNEYMKYTLLAAHQNVMNSKETARGLGTTLCHIVRESNRPKDFVRPHKTKRYVLRVASAGNVEAYLIRKTTNVRLTASSDEFSDNDVKVIKVPDPLLTELPLGNEDEYLVICNSHLWRVLNIERVAREVRKEENPILAAKRIQDIAQSFGATENLSVIVVKFRNIGTDVDRLIKELKKTVRKKPAPLVPPPPNCCERNQTCRHRIVNPPGQQLRQITATRSDRSSPSGQSDQALSPLLKDPCEADGEFVLAHARILEEDNKLEMLDETDSALSEEQFKCWEYMLEQNTQLLFDKELNTISKSFTNNRARNLQQEQKIERPENVLPNFNKTNLLRNVNNKILSNSSPQLLYSEVRKPFLGTTFQPNITVQQQHQQQQHQHQQQVSFLSKHFGSSRSFQSPGYNPFDSRSRESLAFGGGVYPSKLGGGPNAAYFGSLQRLMPYNLEYDFAVMQERGVLDEDDEFLEHENRMRNYWGVATTEL